eukprot:c47105_g1_i1 orf=277-1869(+)
MAPPAQDDSLASRQPSHLEFSSSASLETAFEYSASTMPSFVHAVPEDWTTFENIHRSDFPEGFVFGVATSAYQVEGAVNEGGRGPSIWDTFAYTPGKILDGSNGDIAVDQYHRFQEDIELMANMGWDAYRFSISWSRIFPDGSGNLVNAEGLAYYNRLIDTVLEKGLKPYVTLYHWDLPQTLQDSIGGWLGQDIVQYFANYAETCFDAFGDRVKNWITLNEPLQFSYNGYGSGVHAPGRCSDCSLSPVGNSAVEPYIAAHHALLAHAAAVDIYRKKFKVKQGGAIGIAVDCEWAEPLTNTVQDRDAAQRRVEFQLGWFLDPIYFGDYPAVMRKEVGDRLPQFSPEDISLLRGSLDFVGINHYTTRFATTPPEPKPTQRDYMDDQRVLLSAEVNGKCIGQRAASDWLFVVPWGLQKELMWITERYNKPPIFVTENGMDQEDSQETPLDEFINDNMRVQFFRDYLSSVVRAIREGADVRGYFVWSFLDNFEWSMGYTKRFGIFYVDYADNQKRYAKLSAMWFSKFLKKYLSK